MVQLKVSISIGMNLLSDYKSSSRMNVVWTILLMMLGETVTIFHAFVD